MPIQYASGITAEHRAVRTGCGLFDASHMGEFVVRGSQALDLVQRVTVNDASVLDVGQAQYSAMLERLNKPGPAAPFTLPPEAVLPKLIHALESSRPKARYRVTFPTHMFAVLKRLLPTAALDFLLRKTSEEGRR